MTKFTAFLPEALLDALLKFGRSRTAVMGIVTAGILIGASTYYQTTYYEVVAAPPSPTAVKAGAVVGGATTKATKARSKPTSTSIKASKQETFDSVSVKKKSKGEAAATPASAKVASSSQRKQPKAQQEDDTPIHIVKQDQDYTQQEGEAEPDEAKKAKNKREKNGTTTKPSSRSTSSGHGKRRGSTQNSTPRDDVEDPPKKQLSSGIDARNANELNVEEKVKELNPPGAAHTRPAELSEEEGQQHVDKPVVKKNPGTGSVASGSAGDTRITPKKLTGKDEKNNNYEPKLHQSDSVREDESVAKNLKKQDDQYASLLPDLQKFIKVDGALRTSTSSQSGSGGDTFVIGPVSRGSSSAIGEDTFSSTSSATFTGVSSSPGAGAACKLAATRRAEEVTSSEGGRLMNMEDAGEGSREELQSEEERDTSSCAEDREAKASSHSATSGEQQHELELHDSISSSSSTDPSNSESSEITIDVDHAATATTASNVADPTPQPDTGAEAAITSGGEKEIHGASTAEVDMVTKNSVFSLTSVLGEDLERNMVPDLVYLVGSDAQCSECSAFAPQLGDIVIRGMPPMQSAGLKVLYVVVRDGADEKQSDAISRHAARTGDDARATSTSSPSSEGATSQRFSFSRAYHVKHTNEDQKAQMGSSLSLYYPGSSVVDAGKSFAAKEAEIEKLVTAVGPKSVPALFWTDPDGNLHKENDLISTLKR
ncbi:unnamed protein product [Amoebophrya sp. A120]|nr:unnamed protein product [Amoebophrya sp. A120]|eukprot:GSA120T00002286001.1